MPAGTVLLPGEEPLPLLPPEMAPPVGEAEPAPAPTPALVPGTTEETRVVPLTAAGTPCGPAGMVSATAVLVVTAEGWVVMGSGWVVTGKGWVVTMVGMPVMTPWESSWEVKDVKPLV